MESLGASRMVFGNWPAACPILSPKTAIPVACSCAGWGQSVVPCRGTCPRRATGAGDVLLCAITLSVMLKCLSCPLASQTAWSCVTLILLYSHLMP